MNPTEQLMDMFLTRDSGLDADITPAVIPCAYDSIVQELENLGSKVRPDILVNFGLSKAAQGFTLERLGRNGCNPVLADTAGECFGDGPIIPFGPATVPSRLPLDRIRRMLHDFGLKAEISGDAGGYLCNLTLYLTAGGYLSNLAPDMAGFIHVPPLTGDRDVYAARPVAGLTEDKLWRGACAILAACVDEWRQHSAVKTREHPQIAGSCEPTRGGPHSEHAM